VFVELGAVDELPPQPASASAINPTTARKALEVLIDMTNSR
jgi:hypothetical protein